MPARGWKATGLVQPLWAAYPGGRDALAEAVGTTGTVLSSINSGKRNIGADLARRLAVARNLTIFDLGAPAEAAETQRERRVIDRLRELEAALARLGPDLGALEGLPERVSVLEQQARPRRGKGQ